MAKLEEKPQGMRAGITILIVLFILGLLGAWVISSMNSEEAGNVVVIPVYGTIQLSEGTSILDGSSASSSDIVEQIEKADKDSSIKAIVLDINSPGGSPVASEEIANAISRANKTTVAWIREEGASGAYWAASATDHVIASRMSITGSVGVLASYMDFSELLARYNITENRLVAGKYKDIGSPVKRLSTAEEEILQQKIDLMQQYFLDDVQKNRNLTQVQRQNISTGVFYLGSEALQLHLVDEIGGEKEVQAYLEKNLNTTVQFKHYPVKRSLLETLAGVSNGFSFNMGRGMMSYLVESESKKPMLQM